MISTANISRIMSDETVEFAMTLDPRTDEWLEEAYPEQLSRQERLRAAVTEARRYRELLSKLDKVPDGGEDDD